MPDSLLPTKLLIPTTRPELVPRPQLVQQLDAGLHRALTLISAPAGFGKTTLAAEWVSSLHLDRNQETVLRIAWLSLDEADNDVGRFLAYFLTAIIQQGIVNASTGQSVLEMAQPHQPAPLETIFAPLLRELANSAEKIVVVLDDYHLIDDLPVHKVLNFWIESAPPQVHTILITREDPPLPLARLRARDQMTEFRVNDLRFTEAESTQFLNEIMGIKLSAVSVWLADGSSLDAGPQ